MLGAVSRGPLFGLGTEGHNDRLRPRGFAYRKAPSKGLGATKIPRIGVTPHDSALLFLCVKKHGTNIDYRRITAFKDPIHR